jgi:hypothetical protein
MQYIFDIEDAIAYGLEESVILYNIKYWIMVNKANGVNLFDERTWTYNSIKAYKELYPFWTDKQIRRILKSLQEQNILITGNYNKKAYDRTLWYALLDESILPNGQMEVTKWANGSDQTGEPIPDVNTDNKPNRKPNNKLSEESLFMFDTFWTLYNKKKNKAGCLKAWAKISPEIYSDILAHVGKYITATPNKKYRLNPFRYLSEERWTDEEDSPDEVTTSFDYQQRLAENEKLFGENNGKSIC